jgi:hypothetical protein
MSRERAQAPAGGVAVGERAPAAPQSASAVSRSALALQSTAGNGAVARLAAQGGSAAVLDPAAAAGRAAEAPVPTGPIPEMVPAASATEAQQAAPRQRSWWDRVKSAVSDVLSSIGAGLGALTSRVLGAVAGRARQIPGYGLLTVAIGKDVVTGQSVPRTAVNVIGGLVGLIPGGAALFANLQASGAVERAAAWFGTAWGQLGLTWDYLRGLFRRAWDSLGVRDLLDIGGAWAKLQAVFAPPVQRVLAFAAAAGSKLLELVFEAGLSMAGPLGARVMAIIRRGGAVIGTIFRDPIGFAGRLVAAVRGGLGQFAGRIGHHLKQGLFGWLTGALRGAITLPEKFDLRGILSIVLQLLGATWTWLRARMVRLLGEDRVALLEKAVDWVQRIATEGLSAVWERIAEFATGLVDNVLDAIKEWVGKSVVGAAITKLVTMFNPAGAVIQAIIAAYNTIRFFIERAQQLATLANAVFDSIGAIAGGALGNAMNAVENALSRALPVALGFLARLIGLGDVATPVRGLIERARGVIDGALDRVAGWLQGVAGNVLGRRGTPVGHVAAGGGGAARPTVPGAAGEALKELSHAARQPGATLPLLRERAESIRVARNLRSASVDSVPTGFRFTVVNSPAIVLIEDVRAEMLRASVRRLGIVELQRGLVSADHVGDLTLADVNTLRTVPTVRDEMKAWFRDEKPYTHEHIPTNLLMEVATHAVQTAGPTKANLALALKWLEVQNALRSPTREVIWSFSAEPAAVQIRSHVGSFVDLRSRISIGTRGTGSFHAHLREFFRANKSMHPGEFVLALWNSLDKERRIWDGSGVPAELSNVPLADFGVAYYIDDTSPRGDITLRDLADSQSAAWLRMKQLFLAIGSKQ